MATKWPKYVPVLEARDICRGMEDGPNDTHCLAGWRHTVFATYSIECISAVYREIEIECGVGSHVLFNDDTRNSKAKIAAVWNRTMRKLGYVEVVDV